MNKAEIKQIDNWHQITIEDPASLPGKSIHDVILIFLKIIGFKYVILNDIEGAGKSGVISSLQDQENCVMNLQDLLVVLHDVKQFDWGDFFLFKEYPKDWDHPDKCGYPYLLAQCDTLVRAIDDQYIYIYTPYDSIVQILKASYQIESLKSDRLKNLDYPL